MRKQLQTKMVDLYSEFNQLLYREGADQQSTLFAPIEVQGLTFDTLNTTDPSALRTGKFVGNMNIADGFLQSENFITGSAGWQITASGIVEFNSGTFRGSLVAGSIDIPDTTTANSFHVDSSGNAWWGATTLAASTASITKAGVLTAVSGVIGGTTISATALTGGIFQTATSGQRVLITATGNRMQFYSSTGLVADIGTSTTTAMLFTLETGIKNGISITGAAHSGTAIGFFYTNSNNAASQGVNIVLNSTGVNNSAQGVVVTHSGSGTCFEGSMLGTGYALDLSTTTGANKTTAVARISSVSGEGAHLNLVPIANAPISPTQGDIYADTDFSLYFYDNTAFRQFVLSGPTQTIDGVKTFGSFPVTPSSAPTTDYQVSNKKYVTDSVLAIKRVVGIQVVDTATNTATGDGKAFFRVPSVMNGYNLIGVAMSVYTAGTTNTTTVQIRNITQAADMLTTRITIDSAEVDSSTAAAPAVIDTSNDDVATGDRIAIDVDAIHTTPAKGLFVEMIFQAP